jgi:hypothetical protein
MRIDDLLTNEEIKSHPKRDEIVLVISKDILRVTPNIKIVETLLSAKELSFYEKYALLPVFYISAILLIFVATGTLHTLPHIFDKEESIPVSGSCLF